MNFFLRQKKRLSLKTLMNIQYFDIDNKTQPKILGIGIPLIWTNMNPKIVKKIVAWKFPRTYINVCRKTIWYSFLIKIRLWVSSDVLLLKKTLNS